MKLHVDLGDTSRGSRHVLRAQGIRFAGLCTLLGVNGAGKSTLFDVILGLIPGLHEASVRRSTEQVASSSVRAEFMAAVGHLPQDIPAPRGMSVEDFVRYAAWLKGAELSDEQLLQTLGLVNLSAERSMKMSRLSGGMRRRAGLAAAVAHQPDCLLLDEPNAGLDPVERTRLHAVLGRLSQRRVVIVSTHLLEDLRALGGETFLLRAGRCRPLVGVHSMTDDQVVQAMQDPSEQAA